MASTPPKKSWNPLSREPKKPPANPPATEAKPPGAAPARPPARSGGNTISPYSHGDAIPVPEAIEKDTDTAWAMFSEIETNENRRFLDTVPGTQPMKLSDEERAFAPTAANPLDADPLQAHPSAPPPASTRQVSLGEVLVEARRNNRVCPQPEQWKHLYEMLPNKKHSAAGWEPPPPLIEAAWKTTPAIPKRMCFRQHIEWAGAHGVLNEVFAFMKTLPEGEWYHMGE